MENLQQNKNIQPGLGVEPLLQTTTLKGPDGKIWTVHTPVVSSIEAVPTSNVTEFTALPGSEGQLDNPVDMPPLLETLSGEIGVDTPLDLLVASTIAPTSEAIVIPMAPRSPKKLRWLGAAAAGTATALLAQKGIHTRAVQDHGEYVARKTAGVIGNVGTVVHAKAGDVAASVHEKAQDGRDMAALIGLRRVLAGRKEASARKDIKKFRHRGEQLKHVVDAQDTTYKGNFTPQQDPNGRKLLRIPDGDLRPVDRRSKRQQAKAGRQLHKKYATEMQHHEIRERYETPTPSSERKAHMQQVYNDRSRRDILKYWVDTMGSEEAGYDEYTRRYNQGIDFADPTIHIPTTALSETLYLGERTDPTGRVNRLHAPHIETVAELVEHQRHRQATTWGEKRRQNWDVRRGRALGEKSRELDQKLESSITGTDARGQTAEYRRRIAVQKAWTAHNKRIELGGKAGAAEQAKLARKAQKIARRNARRSTP